MAPNPFSRDEDQPGKADAPADPNEGVRVLGADEVAEVSERAETARRLGPDEKKYGDRPEAPAGDVKPAMRFPLAGTANPDDLERLRPSPVVAPTAGGPVGRGQLADRRPPEPRDEADDRALDDPTLGDEGYDDDGYDDEGYDDEGYRAEGAPGAYGAGDPGDTGELMAPDAGDRVAEPTIAAPATLTDIDLTVAIDEQPIVVAGDEPTSGPVLSVGPPSAESQLPHWTEPATGQVPQVIVGGDAEVGDDDGRWAAFAASPRWRDENTDWSREEGGGFDDLVADEDVPSGALDERDRMMDEDYLTFDDLDVPDAASPVRGTPSDPIKIQRSGRNPAVPAGAASEGRSGSGGRPPEGRPAPATRPAASSGRNRDQAVQIGIALAVGALAIFLLGALTSAKWLPLILIVPIIVGGLAEFFNATARAGFRPITLVGLAAAVGLPLVAYFGGTPGRPAGESGMLLVVALTIAASMAWYLFGAGKGRPVANIAITLAGVLYIPLLGSYAALILRSGIWPGTPENGAQQGIPLLIVVCMGTTMYDVGGYLLGSRIGRTPLSAASPNKTLEGLVVGVVASLLTVVALGAAGVGVQNIGQAIALGLVVALVAPVGDLFESMLKRDLGVKDMSNLIPAHGGILDRVDAYLFTLPAAYYALQMLGLV